MNRMNVFLLSVLALLIPCTAANADTHLFILTEESHRYDQAEIDSLLTQINNVPVYEVDYSSTDTILRGIREDLIFIEGMNESRVKANERIVDDAIEKAIQAHSGAIQEAVEQRALSGELSHRYGIEELPALIELDDDGNYRLVTNPDSLMQGVFKLNGMSFSSEPDNGLNKGRRARNGPNQTTSSPAGNQSTAVARAAGDIVYLVLNGLLTEVPFDSIFPDQLVIDAGSAPDPEDFEGIAFVIDAAAIEQIVQDNPAFQYTGVDDLADYVLEQLDDGHYVTLDADGNLPTPPPVLDPETGEECLSEEDAVAAADAFGNTASFNPCTGEVLSVFVYEHGDAPGDGEVVECLVESELNTVIAENAAAVPEAVTFDNCTGEILTSLIYEDVTEEQIDPVTGEVNIVVIDTIETEVDHNTGLPLCLTDDELNAALAGVPNYGQYDACTGEVFTVFENDEFGNPVEIDLSTGLPFVPFDPDACLVPPDTNPFTDALDFVVTVDPCTGGAITVAEYIDGELVELPVSNTEPVLDCLLPGETAPHTEGVDGVVDVDPCTGLATTVIIDVNGEPTEVPADELVDFDPDNPESINDAINGGIDEILEENPDLPPSDGEVLTESHVDQLLEEVLTDTVPGDSPVEAGSAFPNISYGEGVRYSILDSMLDANRPESFNCLDIRITGACIYAVVRVYCSIFGCDVQVTLEGSLKVTHGNPELLIAAYPRTGDSPITESRELFGRLQLEMSKLVIETVTGHDVPIHYFDTDLWGSTDSDASNTPGTRRFNEVDVIGHPGTFYSLMSAGDIFPITPYTQRLMAAPYNIYDGLGRSIPLIGPLFNAGVDLIFGGGATDPNWPEEPRQRMITADGSLDKGLITWGRDGLVDQQGQPRQWFPNIDAIGENFPTVGELAGAVDLPTLLLVRQIVDAMFFDGALSANDRLIAQVAQIAQLYNDFVNAADLIANILNVIQVATDPAALTDFLNAEIGELDGIVTAFTDGIGLVSDVASFGTDTELWSMCPTGSEFFKPYMLSGFNAIQWKFNVPEILYPQTYIPPFPFFKNYYVGNLSQRDDEGFHFLPNAWGSIYPRVGYVAQTDRLKAAAVVASRAAHVVTRSNQLHAASQIPAYRERYLDIEQPAAYTPSNGETGRWQLVAPQLEEQCVVFGQDDGILDPWTKDKHGNLADTEMLNYPSYVFAFWRDYTCCPEPRKAGAVFYRFLRVATLPFPDITVLN